MRSSSLARWLITASVVALLAGCGGGGGEDSPTGPNVELTQEIADDIAIQASSSVVSGRGGWLAEFEAASAMSGAAPSSLHSLADVPVPVPSETTFTRGGVTINIRRRYFDEAGNELSGYGPTVDRLLATCRAWGSFNGETYDAQVGRASSLDVRNLLAGKDTLAFTGTARDTVQSQFTPMDGSLTHHLYWLSQGWLSNVRALKNAEVNPYPLSGTATWAFSIDVLRSADRGDVERHLDGTVVITFDGTAQPEVAVAGTFRYRLNLDTGALTRI